MYPLRSRAIALFILGLFAIAPYGLAQSTATLAGRVMDPSGAAVPNAQITVRAVGTGVDRTTTSDAQGNGTAPSLQPGTIACA